jgi:hypothetical protein
MTDLDTTAAPDFESIDAAPDGGFFNGDTGVLPLDVREAMARIRQGPFLNGMEHERLWVALMNHRADAKQHFAETFQVLHIDQDRKVAFLKQAETDVPFPVLLRSTPLTLVESALLIVLRLRVSRNAGTDAPVVVDREELHSEVLAFRRLGSTNDAGRAKSVDAAINKLLKNGILRFVRDSDDRFTITPVFTLLFEYEQITRLTAALNAMPGGDSTATTDGDDIDE